MTSFRPTEKMGTNSVRVMRGALLESVHTGPLKLCHATTVTIKIYKVSNSIQEMSEKLLVTHALTKVLN